ncbi:MAG: alpha/beta fold hydrolase [Bacteroidota bacterium]
MGISLLVIGLIALYLLLSNVLPYAVIKPGKQSCTPSSHPLIEAIELEGADSIVLSGITLRADNPIGQILFVHGVGSCKEAYQDLMKYYARRGISTFAFDMRAHGSSGGRYATYGYREKKDIGQIVAWMRQTQPAELPLGIYGNSMGGAISIQATAEVEDIDFAIFESTFAYFPEIVNDYAERISYGLTMKWMVNWVLAKAGKIADFTPEEVAPEQAARHIDIPVLVAHGDADKRINISHARRIFKNLSSTDKELYIVEGGGHADLGIVGGEAYWRKLDGFIMRNVSPEKVE